MTPVRWGILGAGGIAAMVGADVAASSGSVVTAVAARDLDRALALAGRLGAARAYGSYDELVEVAEVERCLAAGATDSDRMPLADSLGVLEVLDEARRLIGVRYDEED